MWILKTNLREKYKNSFIIVLILQSFKYYKQFMIKKNKLFLKGLST